MKITFINVNVPYKRVTSVFRASLAPAVSQNNPNARGIFWGGIFAALQYPNYFGKIKHSEVTSQQIYLKDT